MADTQSDNAMKIEKLDGTNYLTWKFNVKLMLMQKELWGIVEVTEVEFFLPVQIRHIQ